MKNVCHYIVYPMIVEIDCRNRLCDELRLLNELFLIYMPRLRCMNVNRFKRRSSKLLWGKGVSPPKGGGGDHPDRSSDSVCWFVVTKPGANVKENRLYAPHGWNVGRKCEPVCYERWNLHLSSERSGRSASHKSKMNKCELVYCDRIYICTFKVNRSHSCALGTSTSDHWL